MCTEGDMESPPQLKDGDIRPTLGRLTTEGGSVTLSTSAERALEQHWHAVYPAKQLRAYDFHLL